MPWLPPRPHAAPAARGLAAASGWGEPTEIPESSAYRHLVIAYGSNFGANKELAERFAERSHFHGYTSDVITLNEFAESPPYPQPWLLAIMTSTYTSNPPSNATAFKAWLERTEPGTPAWQNCRYLVWGLGNSQWNAFLAFPRYVHKKLAELGAAPLTDFAYGDVGSPVWERLHADWNGRVWPILLELSGARPTAAAAARAAAEQAAAGALTGSDSSTAMHRSLLAAEVAPPPQPVGRATSFTSIMRLMSPGPQAGRLGTGPSGAGASRGCCSPRRSSPTPSGWTRSRRGPSCAGNSWRPAHRSKPGIWSSACRRASATRSATTSACARRTTRTRSSGWPGT